MKIEFVNSACVVIDHNGKKILCDPWLSEDGAFYGSWGHVPPLGVTTRDFKDIDYLYISHIHQDHCDIETLQKFSKNIPVLIASFKQKFLYGCLRGLGFENIIEIGWGEKYRAGDGLYVEIYPSDPDCGSMGIDSYALFSSDDHLVGNFNDCPFPLVEKFLNKTLGQRNLDLLLFPYAGAGPYPQCFLNLSDSEKNKEASIKTQNFYDQACKYIKKMKPRFGVPFAGQYTLGGNLYELNKFRGVPPLNEACDYFKNYVKEKEISSKIVHMSRGDIFDLCEEKIVFKNNSTWTDIQVKEYVEKTLKSKIFSYQKEEEKIMDLFPEFKKAYIKFDRKRESVGFISDFKFYVDFGNSFYYTIPFDGGGVKKIASEKNFTEPYCTLKIDYRLLRRILNRESQYHWNNAMVGSHVLFNRHPNVFMREPYYLLSFFHC